MASMMPRRVLRPVVICHGPAAAIVYGALPPEQAPVDAAAKASTAKRIVDNRVRRVLWRRSELKGGNPRIPLLMCTIIALCGTDELPRGVIRGPTPPIVLVMPRAAVA